jgi:exodeoxyribonuclease V alpha subunit
MIYKNSHDCMQQLCGIEAIDYFVAQQITQELSQTNNELLFHIIIAISWALRQGHTCLPLSELEKKRFWADAELQQSGYLFPAQERLNHCLAPLAISSLDNNVIVYDEQAIYLRRYWQFEIEVAKGIQQRMVHTLLSSQAHDRVGTIIKKLFDESHNEKVDWQQVAVANALGRKLSIISGGPGTGKTYTVTRVLLALQAVNSGTLTIKMAAPTGKAAQRLKESIASAKQMLKQQEIDSALIQSIPEEASTLHRLLGFRPQDLNLKYHADNPLPCDVLLIDEVSMIDLPMMARVLRALSDNSILILLGDANQLPSVETGSIMADIVDYPHPGYPAAAVRQIETLSGQQVIENNGSRYAHLTWLTHSRRFSGEIAKLADEVISLKVQQSWKRLLQFQQKRADFNQAADKQLTYLDETMFSTWLVAAVRHYGRKSNQAKTIKDAFDALAAFRILVPTRTGERGVEALNVITEKQLANDNPDIRPGAHYRGRPVMISENNYSMELFNGDVGLIWPNEQGKLSAWFQSDDQYRSFSVSRLPLHETVYAMTIHKTQGSEFNHVAVIMPEQENSLLSPELLYTGMTRAKQHLYIICSEAVWKSALTERTWRYSGLKQRLTQK